MSDLIGMKDMRLVLREAVNQAGGVRPFSRRLGMVSHSSISLMLSGAKPISGSVAHACGFEVETGFKPRRPSNNKSTLETYRDMLGMS